MKNIYLKITLVILALNLISCDENETEIPEFKPVVYKETFNPNFLQEDTYLVLDGWKSFTEAGIVQWKEQDDDDNGYIQFSTFSPSGTTPVGSANDVAWAITPKINMDKSENEILTFKTAAEFVSSSANKLEVLISNDYDGTNVLTATWTPITASIAGLSTNLPSGSPDGVLNVQSGDIDLSTYSGDIYIAFRAFGSLTNTGSLRVDDIKIYNKNYKN